MKAQWVWRDYPYEATDPRGRLYVFDRTSHTSDVKRLMRGEVPLLECDPDERTLVTSPRTQELIDARCIQRGTSIVTNLGDGEDGEMSTLVNPADKRDIAVVLTWECSP